MKRVLKSRTLSVYILAIFIITIVFVIIRIIGSPTKAPYSEVTVRVKGDYIFMLFQCLAGILAMMLPGFLKRKIRLNIPDIMLITYVLFLFCAIYLGEIRNFYHRVPHWDTILHTFSGVALGALGFSIVDLLNNSGSVSFSLSPLFVALFAFCFALTLGVIWEIFEFSLDFFLGTNAQTHSLKTGEPLIGQAALMDTMKDLIVDAIGAFAMSVIGYVSLKDKKGWLERLRITQDEN